MPRIPASQREKYRQYADDFKADMREFAKHPIAAWPSLRTRVGRNDRTFRSICSHFLDPNGEIIKTEVLLRADLCKQWGMSKSGLTYTMEEFSNTAHIPWRETDSKRCAHLVRRKDAAENDWIQLRICKFDEPKNKKKKLK